MPKKWTNIIWIWVNIIIDMLPNMSIWNLMALFHFLIILFDMSVFCNFFPYVLTISNFRASLELIKTTRNFQLSESAWSQIAFFHFLWSLLNKACFCNFVLYFLDVSIFRSWLELFKKTRNFKLSECAWSQIAFFLCFRSLFDRGAFCNFVPYFLKVSIFRASLELF